MKYAIISDIHANLEALSAVLAKAQDLGVNGYICMGDVVGYNGSPRECIKALQELEPTAVIRGNHDQYASSSAELIGFNPQAAWAVEWTRENLTEDDKEWLRSLPFQATLGSKVTLVHATLDMPAKWGYIFDKWNAAASFNYQRTQVCFFGHTHVPLAFDRFGPVAAGKYREVLFQPGHKYLINVGSVGQPRDGDPRASFATYVPDERKVELHRVSYDLDTCQAKIRQVGLPERCAERLAIGR